MLLIGPAKHALCHDAITAELQCQGLKLKELGFLYLELCLKCGGREVWWSINQYRREFVRVLTVTVSRQRRPQHALAGLKPTADGQRH